MVSVTEADKIIQENPHSFPDISLPLSQAGGEMAREDVFSEREQPPFDRVTMDGIAIAFSSWLQGRRFFSVESVAFAGKSPPSLRDSQNAVEVATGCVLPPGCDSVLRYEDLDKKMNGFELKSGVSLKRGQNVHPRGSDLREGDLVLEKGMLLNAARIGILASAGKTTVRVAKRPRIAVLSTGDELVALEDTPLPFQIRRSNPFAIQAALKDRGYAELEFLHAKDDSEDLQHKVETLLSRNDVLILTGGVSMGKADFVPEILRKTGVSILFHKVEQKPGKPLLFGSSLSKQLVFGLPGNPVSVLVCLVRYVLPALDRGMGFFRRKQSVILEEGFKVKVPDLTLFVPVSAREESGALRAIPSPPNTSGDFSSLVKTEGFVQMDSGKSLFSKGDVLPFFSWGLS